ncbi:hypothetical protein DFJ77DRAFT_150312 [Powellomyces hirtus]|nr:hypothetical protein DFJ77DRAFT_150312 [Powellomyces hirtus]
MRIIVKEELAKRKGAQDVSPEYNLISSQRQSTFEERLAQWVQAEVLIRSLSKPADKVLTVDASTESPFPVVPKEFVGSLIRESTLVDAADRLLDEVLFAETRKVALEVGAYRPSAETADRGQCDAQYVTELLVDDAVASETRLLVVDLISTKRQAPLSSPKSMQDAQMNDDQPPEAPMRYSALLSELRSLREEVLRDGTRRSVEEARRWRKQQDDNMRALEERLRAELKDSLQRDSHQHHQSSMIAIAPVTIFANDSLRVDTPQTAIEREASGRAEFPDEHRQTGNLASKFFEFTGRKEQDSADTSAEYDRYQARLNSLLHEKADILARKVNVAPVEKWAPLKNTSANLPAAEISDLLERKSSDFLEPVTANPKSEAAFEDDAERQANIDQAEETRVRELGQLEKRASRVAVSNRAQSCSPDKELQNAKQGLRDHNTDNGATNGNACIEPVRAMASDPRTGDVPAGGHIAICCLQGSKSYQCRQTEFGRPDSDYPSAGPATLGSSDISSVGITTMSVLMSEGEILTNLYRGSHVACAS